MIGRKLCVGKGNLTRLWKDSINGLTPFQEQFPCLFDICVDQDCTLDILSSITCSSFFRRRLNADLTGQWSNLQDQVRNLNLPNAPDSVYWYLNKSGKYTTKSMYKWLEKPLSGCNYRWIWKAKIPLKIQIFLWQLSQDAVLTRQVMRHRKWPGNPVCSFCQQIETSQHLFFECSVARVVWRSIGVTLGTDLCPKNCWQFFVWCYSFIPDYERFYTVALCAITWSIWLARNRATFENKMIKSPFEIVFTVVFFLLYWAGLQGGDDVKQLRAGAEMIRDGTMRLMRACDATIKIGD